MPRQRSEPLLDGAGVRGSGGVRDRESRDGLAAQVYVDERPAGYFDGHYAWARSHHPGPFQDVIRMVALPLSMILYRAWPDQDWRVPGVGAAILAPNHFSAMDHFFCGAFLRRRVRFMAKSQLFKGPLAWVIRHGGAFPVRRGMRDEEAMATALEILERGGVVVIYPEGGRSRDGGVGDRARPGVGRLALESGAPVVPVAIHGSQRVRRWRRGKFPRVRVRYGEPMSFERVAGSSRQQQQAVAEEVLGSVRDLYATLDRDLAGTPAQAGLAELLPR